MKTITKIGLLTVVLLSTTVAFAQGVTNSSIGGKITNPSGEPLLGANIVAIHTPTGIKYGAATDFDGLYRISNMRTGGPYQITISYVGFEDFIQENLYLQLGQSERISIQLQETAQSLGEVIVTGQVSSGIFDTDKTGAGTKVSRREVRTLPNGSRGIADFARLTPQAQIRNDNVISISGQNNRYNSLYIDGTINNDVFGLADSGTNGGQTGVNPITVDAIESFQVNVAPYDVKIGGFAGGAINAVTRSGDNEFKGTVYEFYRDQNLAGKTPGDNISNRKKLGAFSSNTYGVSAGGPLKKNKVFFFLNYERQSNQTPQPYDESSYGGPTSDAISLVRNRLRDSYNYTTGGTSPTNTLQSNKIFFKLDWNLNEKNNISFRNNYVSADQKSTRASSASRVVFANNGLNFKSTTNTSSLEWSYNGDNTANKFIFGYTRVRDDRNPLGTPFPTIEILDNSDSNRIFAGAEPFSTANKLDTDVYTLTNNFEINTGVHTITIGTHNEFTKVANTFFGRNFGEYTYNSVQDFLNNNANEYRVGYSLLGGIGDNSRGIGKFDVFQLGFYLQDQVQFWDNLKISAGLRFDVPFWGNGRENKNFEEITIPLLLAADKDLRGAKVGQAPTSTIHISPRVGFNWDVNNDKKTQIRGGFGIFTSRMPLVWPGGAYNNNGATSGAYRVFRPRPGNINQTNLVPLFNPNVNTQFKPEGTFQGNVDLLARDLKLPQTFKYSLAVDQRLPLGIVLSGEIIFNETINGINFENLNIDNNTFETTDTGTRTSFKNAGRIDQTYRGVFLVSNTRLGNSWNTNLSASKRFYSSFINAGLNLTYSYGDSKVLFDGTSSQIISNWAKNESVNGSNQLALSRSDFSQGHRIVASSTIDFKWNPRTKTTLGLFYEGAQGTPYSYVIGGRNSNDLLGDTGEGSLALPYIPRQFSDANLVDITDRQGNVTTTAQDQWNALNAFISKDPYLKNRRGKFAERNGARVNWSHIVDLKLTQEFAINIKEKKHRFTLTADIYNFTNLLNKNWGQRFFLGNDNVSLLNFNGFSSDNTTPEFTFNNRIESNINNIDDSGLQSSRWQMQLGIRYNFN